MEESGSGVPLTGVGREGHYHACGFFQTPEEEYMVLVPFIKDGIDHGDKVLQILEPTRQAEFMRRLRGAGIDTETAQESGQLEVRPWAETYLRNGHFDQEAMLNLFDDAMSNHAAAGYPFSNIVSNMDWSAMVSQSFTDVVEYESRFNDVSARHANVTICAFDLTRFSANNMINALRAHPLAIVGGLLYQNPFFVQRETLVPELQTVASTEWPVNEPARVGIDGTRAALSTDLVMVAAGVAEGLSDHEIAELLGIAPRVVATQVDEILVQLGLRLRAQVGMWAMQH